MRLLFWIALLGCSSRAVGLDAGPPNGGSGDGPKDARPPDLPCCDLVPARDPCVPLSEMCNGVDDDCDGVVDNGNPNGGQACGMSTGDCTPGVTTCLGGQLVCAGAAGPTPEKCDRLDNDCDGVTDEAFDLCAVSRCGACDGPGRHGQRGPCDIANAVAECESSGCGGQCDGCATCRIASCLPGYIDCEGDSPPNDCDCACSGSPGPEICDGLDNDCDGLIDEDPSEWTEVCNRRDDDCDGLTDEACCGTAEACNCQDDDCDGFTDDSVFRRCFSGSPANCPDPESGWCIGLCRPGSQSCDTSGCPTPDWSPCLGEVGPAAETCNCQDDDCDGLTDENATCPGGGPCIDCACATPCRMEEEFPCPAGFLCGGACGAGPPDYCVPAPCLGVACDLGSVCEQCTGECVDLCDGVDCGGAPCCAGRCCEAWESCQQAGAGLLACVDVSCTNPAFPCPPEQVCKDHACVDHPCADVHCGAGEFCRDGECLPVCPDCADSEKCVDGRCVPDPCAAIRCSMDYTTCCDGDCLYDVCLVEVKCGPGEYCDPCTSSCREDPCPGIVCPSGFACQRGECVWSGCRVCR